LSSDTGGEPEASGPLGHLRRALRHAEDAVRCYLALFAAEAQRRVSAAVVQAVWALLLAGLGLLGVVLIAVGLATYVESRTATPGAGPFAIGAALIAAVLVVLLVRRSGRRQ